MKAEKTCPRRQHGGHRMDRASPGPHRATFPGAAATRNATVTATSIAAALRKALVLLSEGRSCFLRRTNKRPTTPRGFKEATCDPNGLCALWRRHPRPIEPDQKRRRPYKSNEATKRLGISGYAAREVVRSGDIKSFKIGKRDLLPDSTGSWRANSEVCDDRQMRSPNRLRPARAAYLIRTSGTIDVREASTTFRA
jgi:hypothetical protein